MTVDGIMRCVVHRAFSVKKLEAVAEAARLACSYSYDFEWFYAV